jgi:hypothetical protein
MIRKQFNFQDQEVIIKFENYEDLRSFEDLTKLKGRKI